MQVSMTPQEDFHIDPFMYAGSTLGNALFSGLDLEEVFSCARQAASFEAFDAAVSATIRLKELCMSIEPICDHCGVSVRPRCNAEQAKTCTLNKEGRMSQQAPDNTRKKAPTEIALRMTADEGECDPIQIASHFQSEDDLISIQQGNNLIVLSKGDVDTLIDSLNTINEHLQ